MPDRRRRDSRSRSRDSRSRSRTPPPRQRKRNFPQEEVDIVEKFRDKGESREDFLAMQRALNSAQAERDALAARVEALEQNPVAPKAKKFSRQFLS